MAVRTKRSKEQVSQSSAATKAKSQQKAKLDKAVIEQRKKEVRVLHFAPLPLVFTVLVCSGILWLLSFRDVFATGRPILGEMDEAMLVCSCFKIKTTYLLIFYICLFLTDCLRSFSSFTCSILPNPQISLTSRKDGSNQRQVDLVPLLPRRLMKIEWGPCLFERLVVQQH